MNQSISHDDAAAALASVARARQDVAQEVGLPTWYWWSIAAWWVGISVLNELEIPWLTIAVTVVLGAVHASLAGRLLSGRRRTSDLQVSGDVAGRRTTAAMFALLIVLVAVTVGVGFALNADGMEPPALGAGVFVGTIVALGGPTLLRAARKVFGA